MEIWITMKALYGDAGELMLNGAIFYDIRDDDVERATATAVDIIEVWTKSAWVKGSTKKDKLKVITPTLMNRDLALDRVRFSRKDYVSMAEAKWEQPVGYVPDNVVNMYGRGLIGPPSKGGTAAINADYAPSIVKQREATGCFAAMDMAELREDLVLKIRMTPRALTSRICEPWRREYTRGSRRRCSLVHPWSS